MGTAEDQNCLTCRYENRRCNGRCDAFNKWEPKRSCRPIKIIGISGKMGVGKSTTAMRLNEVLPRSIRYAFADLLKAEVSRLFGFPPEWCYNRKEEVINFHHMEEGESIPKEMTVRETLQWYGTDVIRAREPQRWIRQIVRTIRELHDYDYLIIEDVRFLNEAKFVKDSGGLLVRIEPYDGYIMPTKAVQHISETELDDFQGWNLKLRPGEGDVTASVLEILTMLAKQACVRKIN